MCNTEDRYAAGIRQGDRERHDLASAGCEAMAAASLAWNNGNPAAAFLDLIHLAVSQGAASPNLGPAQPANEQMPAQAAPYSACKSA